MFPIPIYWTIREVSLINSEVQSLCHALSRFPLLFCHQPFPTCPFIPLLGNPFKPCILQETFGLYWDILFHIYLSASFMANILAYCLEFPTVICNSTLGTVPSIEHATYIVSFLLPQIALYPILCIMPGTREPVLTKTD